MCTVSIIYIKNSDPHKSFWRLACNRDEQHTRPLATPPTKKKCGTHIALMPIDPTSQGTWIGVNDHGLVATLLNYNPKRPSSKQRHKKTINRQSRGTLIPQLLQASSLTHAIEKLTAMPLLEFSPFRLVITNGPELITLLNTGQTITQKRYTPDSQPYLFTSSGLGDHLVQPPRKQLFDNYFNHLANQTAAQQDAFHQHQWPNQLELSVCMHRQDAATVSYSTIQWNAQDAKISYHAAAPNVDAQTTFDVLPLCKTTP